MACLKLTYASVQSRSRFPVVSTSKQQQQHVAARLCSKLGFISFLQIKMKTSTKKAFGFRKNKWKLGKVTNNKGKKTTNRQNKLYIKFDPQDRRDYLTGFQKRKRERKEKAYKKLQDDLKAEMKQIKRERKDIVKKMIQQGHELMANGGIGVIDDDEEDDDKASNKIMVNCGSATVEICDLDLTSKHHIGVNQMDTQSDMTESNEVHPSGNKNSEEEEEDVSPENLDRLGIHSQRDLHRSLRKSSARALKHSHLMKQKQVRDATKQRKAQARENNRRKKLQSKRRRHGCTKKSRDA